MRSRHFKIAERVSLNRILRKQNNLTYDISFISEASRTGFVNTNPKELVIVNNKTITFFK